MHHDKVAFCDLSTCEPKLADFVGRLLRKAKRMGIPLWCESASYQVAFLSHSRLGRDLHPMAWEVLGHLGREISVQYRLGISWGGPMMPATWMGTESSPSSMPF